jgi:hypothetical protein
MENTLHHREGCVEECANQKDHGCHDADMFGYVRTCPAAVIPHPRVNEGWGSKACIGNKKWVIAISALVFLAVIALLYFTRR